MRPTVIILKEDLRKNSNLGQELSQLSDKVKELEAACQYFPSDGNLVEFMKILIKYNLDYELQYQE